MLPPHWTSLGFSNNTHTHTAWVGLQGPALTPEFLHGQQVGSTHCGGPSGSPGQLLMGLQVPSVSETCYIFTMSTIQNLTPSLPGKLPHSLAQSPVTPGDLYIGVQGRSSAWRGHGVASGRQEFQPSPAQPALPAMRKLCVPRGTGKDKG